MIKCEKCYNYLYCNQRNIYKDYCDGYKQKTCKSCASYPFCKTCISPRSTCDMYKNNKNILKGEQNGRI